MLKILRLKKLKKKICQKLDNLKLKLNSIILIQLASRFKISPQKFTHSKKVQRLRAFMPHHLNWQQFSYCNLIPFLDYFNIQL